MICIKKRCPHGQRFENFECKKDSYKPIELKFYEDENTENPVDFVKNHDYLLVAPTSGVYEKKSPFIDFTLSTKLLTNGTLTVKKIKKVIHTYF